MDRVRSFRLDNGMMVYYRPGLVNVSGVGFRCGSIYDPIGKVGLSHTLEHVLSQISRKYPNQEANDRFLWSVLGDPDDDWGIYTRREAVFYGHDNVLFRQDMFRVFDIFASFVHPRSRLFPREEFLAERAAVHQEHYYRGKDVVDSLLLDLLIGVMYQRNPARNRIDCEVDHLRKFTLDQIRNHARRYYVPANGFMVMLGPNQRIVRRIAERTFGDWDERRVPTLDYDHSDQFPDISAVRSCEVVRRGLAQYHFALGFPTEPYGSADDVVLEVITHILERRLLRLLRRQNRKFEGGSYRTPVDLDRSFAHGLIQASFASLDREFAIRGEEVILGQFQRLAKELVSADDLAAATKRCQDSYWNAFRNHPGALCDMIIEDVANGDPALQNLHSFPRRLASVDRRRVRSVAEKYFTNGHAQVLMVPA